MPAEAPPAGSSEAREALRLELHQRASEAARQLCARRVRLPDDVRTVVAFWQSSLVACDRAAEQLLAYARAGGIHVPVRGPKPSKDSERP